MASYMIKDVKGGFPKLLLSEDQGYVLKTSCTIPFPFSVLCRQSSGAIRAMNELFKASGIQKKGVITIDNIQGKEYTPTVALDKAKKFVKRL
jgi:hypothetical protein